MQDEEAITPEGLTALKAELEELTGPRRHAMAERIKSARELGDLKENAEYHIAKEDQAHLETKIRRLQDRLRKAVVVEPDAGGGTFGFGCTAEVLDESTGKTMTWTLVGPTEADLGAGKLSAESPVGAALVGAAEGQTVTVEAPKGDRRYRVERLVR